jgi:hypothetical protein
VELTRRWPKPTRVRGAGAAGHGGVAYTAGTPWCSACSDRAGRTGGGGERPSHRTRNHPRHGGTHTPRTGLVIRPAGLRQEQRRQSPRHTQQQRKHGHEEPDRDPRCVKATPASIESGSVSDPPPPPPPPPRGGGGGGAPYTGPGAPPPPPPPLLRVLAADAHSPSAGAALSPSVAMSASVLQRRTARGGGRRGGGGEVATQRAALRPS